MPFSLQPRGYKVAKMPKASSRTGSRSDPRASLASRRSVPWSKQGGAHLPWLSLPLVDETISGPGVHLSAATHQTRAGRGWHLGFLSAHCVTVDTETEQLFWHCIGRAVSSGRRIRLGQVPFFEGRLVLCDRMDFWRIGAVFAAERWSLAFFCRLLGSRSKLLRAR
jgi:hypothetical protein